MRSVMLVEDECRAIAEGILAEFGSFQDWGGWRGKGRRFRKGEYTNIKKPQNTNILLYREPVHLGDGNLKLKRRSGIESLNKLSEAKARYNTPVQSSPDPFTRKV